MTLVDVGVARGWRVLHLPASGQLSNVSACVLPEALPVVDDEHQLPMFSSDDPGRDLLFHVIKLQAEGLRLVVAANQELLRHVTTNGHGASSNGATPRRHVPRNPLHRTWRGFVQCMQKLKGKAKEHELKLTKEAVCQFGPDSVKTVTRTMTLTYGMDSDDWPPSTWDPDRALPKEASGHFL